MGLNCGTSPRPGIATAFRRPLFVALVLGCGVSLLATGTATIRLAGPASIYWAFVPLVETLALLAIVWRPRRRAPLPVLIDTFFAGHGAWTLFVIAIAATMATVSPASWWFLLTRVWIAIAGLVIAWSAYIDYCFFRRILGASPIDACRDVAVDRLLTWTVVFWIFAVPAPDPWTFVREVVGAVEELLR